MTFIPFPSIDTCVFIYQRRLWRILLAVVYLWFWKRKWRKITWRVRTHVNKIGGLFAAVKSTIDRSYLLFTILYGRYIARSWIYSVDWLASSKFWLFLCCIKKQRSEVSSLRLYFEYDRTRNTSFVFDLDLDRSISNIHCIKSNIICLILSHLSLHNYQLPCSSSLIWRSIFF